MNYDTQDLNLCNFSKGLYDEIKKNIMNTHDYVLKFDPDKVWYEQYKDDYPQYMGNIVYTLFSDLFQLRMMSLANHLMHDYCPGYSTSKLSIEADQDLINYTHNMLNITAKLFNKQYPMNFDKF